MAYLEELLPEFRKGAKITNKSRDKSFFVQMRKDNGVINSYSEHYSFDFSDFMSDDWELYQEPIDWDYIIKNKCLCWFWDDDDTDGVMAILVSVYKDSPYRYYCRDLAGCGSSRKHFRPVRRDEVTFYEDKRDGNN